MLAIVFLHTNLSQGFARDENSLHFLYPNGLGYSFPRSGDANELRDLQPLNDPQFNQCYLARKEPLCNA